MLVWENSDQRLIPTDVIDPAFMRDHDRVLTSLINELVVAGLYRRILRLHLIVVCLLQVTRHTCGNDVRPVGLTTAGTWNNVILSQQAVVMLSIQAAILTLVGVTQLDVLAREF